MDRLFAVTFAPSDGPASVVLVEAISSRSALQQVLAYFHGLDMDAIVMDDLSAQELGSVEDITVLGKNLKERSTFVGDSLFIGSEDA